MSYILYNLAFNDDGSRGNMQIRGSPQSPAELKMHPWVKHLRVCYLTLNVLPDFTENSMEGDHIISLLDIYPPVSLEFRERNARGCINIYLLYSVLYAV